jgi:hypothetical protein
MNRPLCFVLMPFGTKPDASGTMVDFDAVYGGLIKLAIMVLCHSDELQDAVWEQDEMDGAEAGA